MKKVIMLISIMVLMMSCNEIKIVNNNITSNMNDDFMIKLVTKQYLIMRNRSIKLKK